MRRLGAAIGRPVVFALTQNDHDPSAYLRMLELSAEAQADGSMVIPQVAARPINLLLGLQTFHPFSYCPSWSRVGLLPVAERVAAMRDPSFRATLLAEVGDMDETMMQFLDPDRVVPMGPDPDYEPALSDTIGARARARGVSPWEEYYDALLGDDGDAIVMRPLLNYSDFDLDAVREMLMSPATRWGLGDGGAHCGTTCDASTPTFMLTHWARDRAEGIPLEQAVRMITSDTAELYGLGDRGVLAPGKVGDVNLIDLDGLRLHRPEMVHDLPGDARRFVQRADGYRATVKAGEVTLLDGEDQGVRPGKLLRGAR